MNASHSKFAANEFSASLLNWASESELVSLERDLMTSSPAALALATSQGKWQAARHLMWLDRALLAALDDAAARQLDGLVVCMPPQHGKSELCSKYLPAWYLGTFPDRRVLLTGYGADFAEQWCRKARDVLIEWGHLFGVRVSAKSAATHRWDLEGRDGGMTAAGVAGPITGMTAHLLIVDDPDQERHRGPQRVSPAATIRLVAIDGQHAAAARGPHAGHPDALAPRRPGGANLERGQDEFATLARAAIAGPGRRPRSAAAPAGRAVVARSVFARSPRAHVRRADELRGRCTSRTRSPKARPNGPTIFSGRRSGSTTGRKTACAA